MPSKPYPVFDNSYARLPGNFYTRQAPVPVAAPGLIRVNHELADYLGFDANWLESETGIEFIAGNHIPDGAEPIATVYAGHQFGSWNPQLGDGRAILLGEVIASDGVRHDIQLKGSGRTAYSRGGDGRSPLGPVLREYIVSEAMAVLGVPTTRALAAATSGESVFREGRLPGAVLTRVAQSHIRIGTFQFFASKQDLNSLRLLVDHIIERHYPDAKETENPLQTMLEGVVKRQARLITQWQLLGFIHGVMNTDNMLLSGETVDYGPCAFMDEFDPGTVFSSIDHGGRYAYQNQPPIAHWNLARLVQSVLPMLDADEEKALATGQAIIDAFPDQLQSVYRDGIYRKLGLAGDESGYAALTQDFLSLMESEKTDFTLSFRRLADLVAPETASGGGVGSIFEFSSAFDAWLKQWRAALANDPRAPTIIQVDMNMSNPVFIPRNHLVEEAIKAAETEQDFAPFHALVEILAKPFDFDHEQVRYAMPPPPGQRVHQTFCGT